MSKENDKARVKAATSKPMIKTGIKLFEILCLKCRTQLLIAAKQSTRLSFEKGEANMTKALNNLCPECEKKKGELINGN